MKDLHYITTSSRKFALAQKYIAERDADINLIQLSEETPEIQSTSVEEIATYSAREMYQRHQEPVVVSDTGLYIPGLNGFPGPYIKQVNEWLTPEDLLRLSAELTDRSVEFHDCLAFIDEDGEVHTFTSVVKGELSLEPRGDESAPVNTFFFFIPEGETRTLAEYEPTAREKFFYDTHTHWRKLLSFIE